MFLLFVFVCGFFFHYGDCFWDIICSERVDLSFLNRVWLGRRHAVDFATGIVLSFSTSFFLLGDTE